MAARREKNVQVYAEDVTDVMMDEITKIAMEGFHLNFDEFLASKVFTRVADHIRTNLDKRYGRASALPSTRPPSSTHIPHPSTQRSARTPRPSIFQSVFACRLENPALVARALVSVRCCTHLCRVASWPSTLLLSSSHFALPLCLFACVRVLAESHCVVVGRSFGAFVTHRTKSYMFFSVTPGVNCLVWKI